ncbi:hypothetical protein [Lacticaseibacillus daqingensis]|uniref:hypothetical protein n=1 Tax=Lacticaseibacillus daqingensis TaxID=2486014 RepID=UPI000F7A7C55|nr:hypothetical protein [Lacticaseibacillus daqingensis]
MKKPRVILVLIADCGLLALIVAHWFGSPFSPLKAAFMGLLLTGLIWQGAVRARHQSGIRKIQRRFELMVFVFGWVSVVVRALC